MSVIVGGGWGLKSGGRRRKAEGWVLGLVPSAQPSCSSALRQTAPGSSVGTSAAKLGYLLYHQATGRLNFWQGPPEAGEGEMGEALCSGQADSITPGMDVDELIQHKLFSDIEGNPTPPLLRVWFCFNCGGIHATK